MTTLTLRLPDDLHETIRQQAAKDHRSLNAQIVWLLEQALQPEGES